MNTKCRRGTSGTAPSPLLGEGLARALMAIGTVPSMLRGTKLMICTTDLQRFIDTMPSHRNMSQGRAA